VGRKLAHSSLGAGRALASVLESEPYLAHWRSGRASFETRFRNGFVVRGECRTKIEPPYGLRVAPDCRHLEAHPEEREVLATMLEVIRDDKPLSEVANALNHRGFRTRSGSAWTQVGVFDMLPRLIDAAPSTAAVAGAASAFASTLRRLSPSAWPSPPFLPWLIIARIARTAPESLAAVRGTASLRWQSSDGWQSPLTLRLESGVPVHAPGAGLFPFALEVG